MDDSILNPSRRKFLEMSSAALAASALPAAAYAQTQEEVEKGEHSNAASLPLGKQNPELDAQNPDSETPPPTDHGSVKPFWYPFDVSHKRIQPGGWTRQVTIQDLPVSKDIAGVQMRLETNGIRELHWHLADEWAMMLYGNARITCIDPDGKTFVDDVKAGDLWYFPSGYPHSIQGLGPDGCEFLLVFDDGAFNEFDTVLLTDWLVHTPPSVLAKNFGVPASAFPKYPSEGRYIFLGSTPGPLEEQRRQAEGDLGPSRQSFDFRMMEMQPTFKTAGGEVRIVDSRNFPVSQHVTAAHVIVHPGGLREMHWHPNADEWQYYIKGKGRMTVFEAGGRARTMDFQAGSVGYVQQTFPHYVENTGDEDLIFLEMFRTNVYQDVSLNNWLAHLPEQLVLDHLQVSKETLAKFPKKEYVVLPK